MSAYNFQKGVNKMRQILKEKQKFISYENFVSLWTEQKELHGNGYFNPPRLTGLDFSENKFCMVGEAHHFSNSYEQQGTNYCRKCASFSNNLNGVTTISAVDAKNGTIQNFHKFKRLLYDHMIDKHPELMSK